MQAMLAKFNYTRIRICPYTVLTNKTDWFTLHTWHGWERGTTALYPLPLLPEGGLRHKLKAIARRFIKFTGGFPCKEESEWTVTLQLTEKRCRTHYENLWPLQHDA